MARQRLRIRPPGRASSGRASGVLVIPGAKDSFIPYRETDAFARRLEAWLEDLETGLLPFDPEAAWSLVDRFLRTDVQILGAVHLGLDAEVLPAETMLDEG